eukprot:3281260-Prymnesium_polylepis.1
MLIRTRGASAGSPGGNQVRSGSAVPRCRRRCRRVEGTAIAVAVHRAEVRGADDVAAPWDVSCPSRRDRIFSGPVATPGWR